MIILTVTLLTRETPTDHSSTHPVLCRQRVLHPHELLQVPHRDGGRTLQVPPVVVLEHLFAVFNTISVLFRLLATITTFTVHFFNVTQLSVVCTFGGPVQAGLVVLQRERDRVIRTVKLIVVPHVGGYLKRTCMSFALLRTFVVALTQSS